MPSRPHSDSAATLSRVTHSRTCLVSFRTPAGAMYVHVTGGRSLFGAVGNALAWFEDDHWKGPRPNERTVFDVTFVGCNARYFREV